MPKSVFTDAYVSLRELLVALRKERGLTQVELSKRLGKSQPFISYVESGERRIDVVEFYAIVRALDGDPTKVFAKFARKLPRRVDI